MIAHNFSGVNNNLLLKMQRVLAFAEAVMGSFYDLFLPFHGTVKLYFQ